MFSVRWDSGLLRSLGQALTAVLVAATFVLFPQQTPQAQASGVLADGSNSVIDYAADALANSFYVSNGTDLQAGSTLTFEAWVKPRSLMTDPVDHVLVAKHHDYAVAVNSGEWVYWAGDGNGGWGTRFFTGVSVSPGAWIHISLVLDGNNAHFFVNGHEVDSTNTRQITNDATLVFSLGEWIQGVGGFDAEIDEVRVWNTSRAAQLASAMHTRVDPNDPDLLAYWDFNEGSGTTIHDRTGNHDLTVRSEPDFIDVKQATSVAGGDTVITFPRTYLPGVGGWQPPTGVATLTTLVVGGGGGGGGTGGRSFSGGGGAGGVATLTDVEHEIGSIYEVTVGLGGRGGSATARANPQDLPQNGQGSNFGSVVSASGGGSGGHALITSYNDDESRPGLGGGGGAQAGGFHDGGGPLNGFSGGSGFGSPSENLQAAGGGAGATGNGVSASSGVAGAGGPGLSSSIAVTAATYGGGGGGGKRELTGSAGTGGAGGGGDGGLNAAGTDGGSNLGGGGGGAGGEELRGGNGGSGVVVVRYKNVLDNSFVFSGTSNKYLETTDQVFDGGDFTVETWVNFSDLPEVGENSFCLFSQGTSSTQRFYICLNTSHNFYFGWGGSSTGTASSVKVEQDQWYHVALARSSGTPSVFINGASVELSSATSNTGTPATLSRIGDYFDGNYPMAGHLDNFKVWSEALDATEINESMHSYSSSPETLDKTLIAHYDFNEFSNDLVIDRSGQGRHLSPASGQNLSSAALTDSRIIESGSSSAQDVYFKFNRSYLTALGGWTVPGGITSAEVLAVAGGGAGGTRHGGGGGAGELALGENYSLTPGSAMRIVVGMGGVGNPATTGTGLLPGNSGQTTSFGVTSLRGGGGGNFGVGGSGGGGNDNASASLAGTSLKNSDTSEFSFYGNVGGLALEQANPNTDNDWAGGGGGGAGGVGGNATGESVTERESGAGGAGTSSAITGTSACYAAGGSGGSGYDNKGSGLPGSCVGVASSAGVGGNSSSQVATSALPNSGSGGGGGGYKVTTNWQTGSGGSGVVIFSYSLAPDAPTSLIATQSTSHATVNLSWTAPSYTGNSSITDYDIEFKPAGGSWTSYSDGVSTATTAAVQLPQQCIAHEFRVIAKNTNFSSVASATASATPVWGTFGSLTGVQISSTNSECVVKFTSTTSSTWTSPSGTTNIDALLVGGGGGGGAWVGGGGGGGGFVETSITFSPSAVLTISVGDGGTGAFKDGIGSVADAANGQQSQILHSGGTTTAYGGGAGGSWRNDYPSGDVATGGGAAGDPTTSGHTPTVTGQGFSGGARVDTAQPHAAGGGGGAGGPGQDQQSNLIAGNGGVGSSSSITGFATLYGGGGGGGVHGTNVGNTNNNDGTVGVGGADGGGAGSGPNRTDWSGNNTGQAPVGQSGQDGTGGGGGGAGHPALADWSSRGGDGGSGLVVIRQLSVGAPAISTQPQGASAEPGQTKTLTVAATGNGTLSYQWQSSTDGTNWTNVGTNSSSYTTPTLSLADGRIRYRVGVTNTLNGQTSTVTSSEAVISVTGVTLTVGACSAMVGDDSGVTISETANGGCLVKYTETGSNTFFVPNLVSSIQAYIIGGGGGGGGAKLGEGGGGGGGGGASRLLTLAVTGSQVIPLSVATGGAGGAANSNGIDGGSTTFSASYTVPGGKAGKSPTSWPGGGGVGGTGATGQAYVSSGYSGGNGVTDPGDRSYYQPKYGSGGSWRTFAGQLWCVGGGGGGGNREVADDPYFHWAAISSTCSNGVQGSGGVGGWHNGTTNILPTSGVANTGGGGGGGSYDSSLNVARSGASGADGLVAIYFTPSTGEISLSALAAVSYSGTTHTINLSRDNDTTDVTWTTSNAAVCTVSGGQSSATVTELAAGLCEVSVVLGAKSPYARGTAATSFQIDKISRSTPNWTNNSLSIPFGGTFDLRPRLSNPGTDVFTFSTSGTVGSCYVTGYTLTVGSVGDTCSVTPTLVGTNIYLDMVGTTQLSVTVTKISQSALVLTSATSMNVDQTLTLSAAGGSGTGILEYFVASQGGTSCAVNQSTGALTATAAGSCEVYAKRALSTNYDEVTSSHVVITVNKISQNLSWVSQPQAQYLAGNTYALEATASSQLTVAYSISAGLCTLSGTTVTFTGSGDCVIHAGQSGNSSYLEAVTISQTVSVGKINQTMTFSALADKSWGSLAFSVSATASSGLNIAYTENNQTTNDACDVSTNGIVTIKNVGTCAITSTQAGNSAYTAVTTTRLFEVTANQAGAPFIGSVSFGDRQLNASFFTPSYLGGGTVAAYELRAYELDGTLASTNTGCIANAGATQSCSVIGLDNGKKYVLRAAAITQAGRGEFSASSSEIIPAANPEAVGNLIAIEGNGTLSLQWTEPASFGGANFFQYRIYWRAPGQQYQADGSPGATVGTQSSTAYVITGLSNGVAYDVKIVTATSNNNVELQSNTAEVRQTPFTVPDAPAAVVALDNDNNVVVAWQAPIFDGGNQIDQYVVEKDGTAVCTITSATTTSCEVEKPSPGNTSVIEVRAGNDAGLSAPVSTSITVAALPGPTPPGLIGGGGFPGVTPGATAPLVLDVSGSATVTTNEVVRLVGTNFNLVEKVLIGGVEASFFVNNSQLITIRIPVEVAAGNPTITLQGSFGSRIFTGLIQVSVTQVSIDTKVTIGTFLGYAAVYTKNHEGKRLSMKIGNKWRVIESLGGNYTYNYTKVGVGRTVTVEVYIDRVLVQVKQIRIQ